MFDFLSALDESKSMLSVQQVADMLALHRNTIHKMFGKRDIPSWCSGTVRKLRVSENSGYGRGEAGLD